MHGENCNANAQTNTKFHVCCKGVTSRKPKWQALFITIQKSGNTGKSIQSRSKNKTRSPTHETKNQEKLTAEEKINRLIVRAAQQQSAPSSHQEQEKLNNKGKSATTPREK